MHDIPNRTFAALAPSRRRARAREQGFAVRYVCAPMLSASCEARPRRGETIRRFVDRVGWEKRGLPIVCGETVDGELRPILRRDWSRRIRKRDGIAFVVMPMGAGGGVGEGGSSQVGSIVALVALVAFAAVGQPWLAAALTPALGATFAGVAASVAGALIVTGGAYLISHFLSAIPKGAVATPIYSVQITSNQARSQEPIPCQYGKLKFFPDLAASVYDDYSGINQIFHALYSLGVGDFDVAEIGVGLTPIWTAAHGLSAAFPGFQFQIVPPDTDCTLFPTNVITSSSVSGQTLPDAHDTGDFVYVGPFIVGESGTLTNTIAVDLIWPGGLFTSVDSSGSTSSNSVTIDCRYQYVDGSGTPTGAVLLGFNKTYTRNSKTPVRITESFAISPGRVQVKIARSGKNNIGTKVDTVSWGALKAYLQGPNAVPNATRLAVQILADKQLSSYSAQQIYVIATRKIPVWNGTALVEQATQNPVWAALDIWSNTAYGAGLSVNDVDLVTLKNYADAADTRGDTFNFRFVQQTPVIDALSTALKGMLASPVFVWDHLSMVRDESRGIPTISLTDFEIARGSLSVAYTLQDAQTSDGTIVEYFDETTWAAAEVRSVDDDVDLLQPSRVQADGVTNRRQAVVYARYLAASTAYRRKTLTLTVEAEGKLLQRGNLVSVQSETPNTWGAAFRIEAADTVSRSLTLHAAADWSSGAQHYLRIKTPTGAGFGPVKCARGASDSIAVLDGTDLALVETQQGITLADVVARTAVEETPSASLSVAAPQEFLGLVTGLANSGENQFTLMLVVDAPQIYTIDTASVPPLPTPSPLALPSTPGVIDPLNAYMRQSDVVSVTLYVSWNPDPASRTYTAQISYDADPGDPTTDDSATWTTVYPDGEIPSFFVAGLAPSDVVLRVRGTSSAGIRGPWAREGVTSPTVNSQPRNLGYQIQYYDIQPATPDTSIGDDINELTAFVSHVDLATQVQSAQALGAAAQTAIIQLVTGGLPGIVLDFASATTGLTAQVAGIQAALTTLTLTEVTDVAALSASIASLSATVSGISTAILTTISAAQATVNAATAAQQTDLGVAFGIEDDKNELQQFINQVGTAGSTATALGIISGAQAITSQQTVVNANGVQALTQITTTQASQIAANTALIQTVSTTLTTAESALSSSITTLTATVNANNTAINASLTTEATTRATADTAISATVATLTATVSFNSTTINASLGTEASTRASADSAISALLATLTGTVTTNNTTLTASLATEASTRLTNDNALSALLASLTSTVTTNNTTITASLATESSTRATADTALSVSIASLGSTVTSNNTTITASLATESSTRATADTALSTSISSLTSTVNSNNTTITASLGTESTTRATADTALSSSISSVSAIANAGTASGQIVFSAQSAPAGVSARFSLDLYATGFSPTQAGFYMDAVAGGGGRIVFKANTFQVEDPTTRVVPFGISGGAVYLQGITYVSSTLLAQSVTTAGSTIGQPVMQLDFVNGTQTFYDNT